MSKQAEFAAPFDQFNTWFEKAKANESDLPEAMSVASATPEGLPSMRMVLMKGFDQRGVVFYTNFNSQKGRELQANPHASVLFHWKSLMRQVRIEGTVEVVSDTEADAYFSSRPRSSRIGAWASQQSEPMEGMFEFEAAIAKYTAKFGVGDIPRPPNWSGFRIVPNRFEFWEDRKFRLHFRDIFTLNNAGDSWSKHVLYP